MTAPAHAQFAPLLGVEIPFDISRGNNVSVLERDRPELDPLGVPAGSFLIFPSLQLGEGYTSNVYGSAASKTSDAFFTIDPTIVAQSRWSRNSLNFKADGSFKRFADQTLKNESGYYVGADGQIDIVGDSNIYGLLSYERAYDPEYAGDFPAQAAGSVAYNRLNGILRGTYEFDRVRTIVNFDVNKLDYSDSVTINGDKLDQKYRNRTVYRMSGRVEYAVTPDIAGFVQTTYEIHDYQSDAAIGLDQNRSGHGLRVLGGVTFDLTSLVRAAIGVGYTQRTYDQPNLPQIGTFAADVRLTYFPSGLTTVSLGVRRDIEDAIVTNSPGYVLTSEQVRVDHELLRNLLLFTSFQHEVDRFKAVSRNDRLIVAEAGGTYLANRHLQFGPTLSYIDRSSRGLPIGQNFNEFRALLTVKVQM